MMRFGSYVLVLLAAFCASAFAAPATLDLREVSLPDFSRVVFKEMLKADYVLLPDAVASDVRLSVSLSNRQEAAIVDAVRETFVAAGFTLVKRGGVYFIAKKKIEQKPGDSALSAEFRTYKSKARSLAYLTKLAKFAGAQVVDGDVVGDVLVYSAPDDVHKRVQAVFAIVDTPAQAVTIRAALVEYSDSSDKGRAVALSVLSQRLKAVYQAGPTLANSVTVIGGTVQAALSAIDGDSRFSYLSQPMLRVLDGETARLSVGADVPVRGAVTLDKNGTALQSVDYQSSGVILNVQPRIVGDVITLKIDQQISSFTTTTTSNIDSPSLLKRQASTTVDIRKGQLIILAGLDEDKETTAHSGFSFMPSWAQSASIGKAKSQILLLLEVPADEPI